METGKKTPLYATHQALGGRMVEFSGWALPVQYSSILEEHKAVRERVGLFDVSHMGELFVRGAGAFDYLQRLLTNDFTGMRAGRCRYSPMCYADGGTADDVIVYQLSDTEYMIVVNAGNTSKDFDWMRERSGGFDVTLQNESAAWAQLALQGPKAQELLAPLAGGALPQKNYTFTPQADVGGVCALISRTGYTGEDGFELYCAASDGERLHALLMKEGERLGILPCGLGARDTLRFEASMPLYGHELTREITPKEAGLGFAVKLSKPDFIGREALMADRKRARIGLKLTGRGIAREGVEVRAHGERVGVTTSGGPAPTLGGNYAMALVDADAAAAGAFELMVRGKPIAAINAPMPFYKRRQ